MGAHHQEQTCTEITFPFKETHKHEISPLMHTLSHAHTHSHTCAHMHTHWDNYVNVQPHALGRIISGLSLDSRPPGIKLQKRGRLGTEKLGRKGPTVQVFGQTQISAPNSRKDEWCLIKSENQKHFWLYFVLKWQQGVVKTGGLANCPSRRERKVPAGLGMGQGSEG